MGLFDKIGSAIKGQLLDVIAWTDDTSDTIVNKFEMGNKEIMMNAKLTVRESQIAIFVCEGKLADVFSPGMYTLSTQNLPIMTALQSWAYGFNSPFKAEVYFINTKQFTDQRWGTPNPVMLRDADFGIVRLRAFGTFAFRVDNAVVFMKELFGTNSLYTVSDISDYLKKMIVSGFSDSVAESKIPALDLAASYDELGDLVCGKLVDKFTSLGLKLQTLIVENISLPEEVEKAMDQRSSMGALGDLGKFTQFQSANAIRDAAQNQSGGAGLGAGMGAGIGLGQMMGQAMGQGFSQQQQPQQQPVSSPQPASGGVRCGECGASVASGKFCPECGKPLAAKKRFCAECGVEMPTTSRFCPECGTPQA